METEDKKPEEVTEPIKTKYLFGRVHVETVELETELSKEQAFEFAKMKFADPENKSLKGIRNVYFLPWAEGGTICTEVERQKVLGAFLQLIDQVIPKTPSVDAPRIIIPTEFAQDGKPIFTLEDRDKNPRNRN